MDSGITIKHRPGVSARTHTLRDPVTVRETTETELDPSKTVAATAEGGGGAKHNGGGPHHEAAASDLVIDPKTQEALFSAIDVRAEPAEQSPNQALLRLRAYRQRPAPTEESAPADSDPHADIEA